MPRFISVDNGARLIPVVEVSRQELLKIEKDFDEQEKMLIKQRVDVLAEAKALQEKVIKEEEMPNNVSVNGKLYPPEACEHVDGAWRLKVEAPVVEEKVEVKEEVKAPVEEVKATPKKKRKKAIS